MAAKKKILYRSRNRVKSLFLGLHAPIEKFVMLADVRSAAP